MEIIVYEILSLPPHLMVNRIQKWHLQVVSNGIEISDAHFSSNGEKINQIQKELNNITAIYLSRKADVVLTIRPEANAQSQTQ